MKYEYLAKYTDEGIKKTIDVVGIALLTILTIRSLIEFLQWTLETYWLKRDDTKIGQRSFKGIVVVLKVLIWGAGITFLLDNLGFEITTVIAGLGIGGRGTNVTDSLFFGNTKMANIIFEGDGNTVRNSQVIGEVDDSKPAAAGILFNAGRNNLVIDSTLERHNGSTLRTSADVRVGSGDVEINGNIIDTKMLSARTIIFGYPTYSSTHLTVQNYIAPNDNQSKVPKNFTLWRIDNQMNDAEPDFYFVALVQETHP